MQVTSFVCEFASMQPTQECDLACACDGWPIEVQDWKQSLRATVNYCLTNYSVHQQNFIARKRCHTANTVLSIAACTDEALLQ